MDQEISPQDHSTSPDVESDADFEYEKTNGKKVRINMEWYEYLIVGAYGLVALYITLRYA